MDNRNGYYNQWPSGPPGNPRFLPLQGTFSSVPGDVFRSQAPPIQQQQPTHFSQPQFIAPQQAYQQPQAHFTPLIPLSAVEDLQLPQVPFVGSALPENLSRVPFNSSGPVVHEGYIPAPGGNDEDEYPGNQYNGLFRNPEMESSDDGSSNGDELTFEEQMRELEAKDNSEVDADYSEEEALEDAGDPDEMELDVPYEDEEERIRRKPSKPGPVTEKATRGRPRGRPSTRGRGGHTGSLPTRGRKPRMPGRPKGRRGPRAVADPGHEFRELQRQANERLVANDFPAALEFAQRAIQLNPEIFDAHNIASEAFAAMGEQMKSIEVLIIGAPTKRDPGLWHVIIDRINSLDPEAYPELTDVVKTALILNCLKQIVALDIENYEARSNILEIEASLGHVSKCVKMGRKMLKLRKEKRKAPDIEVLKIMAMMGTSSKKQTRNHLEKLITSFDEAIESFTRKKPEDSPFDWEMINIYLDLLDKSQQYDYALRRLKSLARWKQGRSKEKYWDDIEDDREYDIEDNRRIAVPEFKKIKSHHARHGETLPLEIRVKLGLFRLRRSVDDFPEAMHHLEMLEPDDDGPNGLVWDYEDLFRVIGDALHATGHDKDALRFYEPLYNKQSQELTLMSYIGIHTCYVNLGEREKADPIVPILKDWNAETVDDLVITAMFFEKQGMLAEAIQRAQILYKNKYAHRLRNLGFRAYDELRDVYDQERKKARGKHGVKKKTVKKHRSLMSKATGRDGVNDDDTILDGVPGALPSLGPLSERPVQGLFRTKRTTKPPKGQIFLPLQAENVEPGPVISSRPSTLEGTGVPLHAIDHRFFRRKLQRLAKDYSEELQAARAQHREITASFTRLDEVAEAAENGDEHAVKEVLSITRELIEEYSTFDLFYSDRKEEFATYFRRTGNNEIWRESAIMVLAVVANNVEDGETDPELKERPDEVPEDFWGIHFDRWLDAFGRYAVIIAREGDDSRCFSTLDIAIQSNIVFRSKQYYHQFQLCRLVCALAVDDSYQASMAVRWLLKENPFGSDLFRLYSCVNRLCSIPEGYATGPAHKILIRYIKTMDFALLTEKERVWYNFRDRKDTAGGFQNSVNIEDVKFVRGHDPALFALYAHVLMCGGSYIAALNYYFRAFAITPDDPVLNLSIGVAYIQHAMKRLSENRQFQIQQGLAFINRYYQLCIQDGAAILLQEAEFNRARIWHGLGLVSLAIPAYEKVIELSERVRQEESDQCTNEELGGYEDFKYEAAFAIQSIYAISGNLEGARKITEEVLVLR